MTANLNCINLIPEFTFIDLFAGIGGFHAAAIKLGGRCVFASEIDECAQKTYLANYGLKPQGDITQIASNKIPVHDMLFAGFPCQPFSIMGKKQGFTDDRGSLFFEIIRILSDKQSPIFILENVKQLVTHNQGQTLTTILNSLNELGYTIYWQVLNALNYGLPQKRERLIIVGFLNQKIKFEFPKPLPRVDLSNILEDETKIDKKYFASNYIKNRRLKAHTSSYYPAIWHENKGGNIASYPYSCALRAGASHNYLLVNGVRRLTPREMLRLQGFSDNSKIICNDSQTKKQAGNAVPVPMIYAVLEQVLHAIT